MKAGMTDDKPARVPARANQRWHAARIKALLDTESPKVILGDECEKPLPLARDPLTGKPDAGDPPVRFGGRGGALRHPYPYCSALSARCHCMARKKSSEPHRMIKN